MKIFNNNLHSTKEAAILRDSEKMQNANKLLQKKLKNAMEACEYFAEILEENNIKMTGKHHQRLKEIFEGEGDADPEC